MNAEQISDAEPRAGRARLLVVDDEEMVRMVISAVLVQQGYEVVEAIDGDDALRKCRGTVFHLVLVDMFMPHLNGLETLKRLRELQPRLRGLLLSGVPDVDELARTHELPGVAFVQKPFDNVKLAKVVAEMLSNA